MRKKETAPWMNLHFGHDNQGDTQSVSSSASNVADVEAEQQSSIALAKQRVEALADVEAVLRHALLEEDPSLRKELVQWLAASFSVLDEDAALPTDDKADCILRYFGREPHVEVPPKRETEGAVTFTKHNNSSFFLPGAGYSPSYTEALLRLLCRNRAPQVVEELLALKHGQSSVSPIVAAHVRSKFSRLDVVATIHNFLPQRGIY
ncbi:hypothetical protein QOT17_019447 [Balamuthia mandrillaris]